MIKESRILRIDIEVDVENYMISRVPETGSEFNEVIAVPSNRFSGVSCNRLAH